jgi:hypothetical protein
METITNNISDLTTIDLFVMTLLVTALVWIMVYIYNDDEV